MDRPFGLLAELTYACPLHCPYCSNPLNLGDYREELTTAEWQQVLAEARELGVLQLHLSGGEPLQRRDLVEIVRTASELGLYTNLITSALRPVVPPRRGAAAARALITCRSASRPMSRPCPTASPARRRSGARWRPPGW